MFGRLCLLILLFGVQAVQAHTTWLLDYHSKGYSLVGIENGEQISSRSLGGSVEFGVSKDIAAIFSQRECANCWRLQVMEQKNGEMIFKKDFRVELLRSLQGPVGRIVHLEGTDEIYFVTLKDGQKVTAVLNSVNFRTGDHEGLDLPEHLGLPDLNPYKNTIGVFNSRNGSIGFLDRATGKVDILQKSESPDHKEFGFYKYFYLKDHGLYRVEQAEGDTVDGTESLRAVQAAFGKRLILNGKVGAIMVHPDQSRFVIGVLTPQRNLSRIIDASADLKMQREYPIPFKSKGFTADPALRFIKFINTDNGALMVFDVQSHVMEHPMAFQEEFQFPTDYINSKVLIPQAMR